jgi:polyphosphate kinase
VKSVVGRYLEHSRIFHFANGRGRGRPTILIGSGDLMPRNLDRRVEALVEITDAVVRERIEHILEENLADEHLSWNLGSDGDYVREVPITGSGRNLHEVLGVEAAENVTLETQLLRPSFDI